MGYYETIFTSICINLVAILSMFMLIGLTGIFSMGQASFMCVGAYTAGMLATKTSLPFGICLLLAIAVGMLFSLLVGLPVIKLRRDYIALITLGFGEAVVALLNNMAAVFGGAQGINGIPRKMSPVLAVAILAVVLYVMVKFKNSRYGRMCIAIKNDEISSAAMGINVNRIKLLTFVLAGGITALSGGMLAFLTTYIEPAAFGTARSIEWISTIYIGGINSLTGSVIAGILYNILPEALRFASALRIVVQCTIVLLIINFLPNGVFGEYELPGLIRLIAKKVRKALSRISKNPLKEAE